MSNPRIQRLRDRLLERGQALSLPPPHAAGAPELNELGQRIRPFAETIYLVVSADAEVGARERDVLRGALRMLTDGLLSSTAMERMLSEFEVAHAQQGTELRLDAIASLLYVDRADAELAIALAIAAAAADPRLDPRESSVIFGLAERLGVKPARVEAMLAAPAG